MNSLRNPNPKLRSLFLAGLCLLAGHGAAFATSQLQGQNKGDTNTWSGVNLQNWQELDYIPFRVYVDKSPGILAITINFLHLSGTTPGFQDLTGFTLFTPNVVFISTPGLTTDPSGVWNYQFTITVTDNTPAEVRFLARLAAGAHINGGSSLHLTSNVGDVQIHKPAPCPDHADLAIQKMGPASVQAGGIITYTLSYTNQADAHTAFGAQITDILPSCNTLNTNSLTSHA